MPVLAKPGLSLYAIWRYANYDKRWVHVGYTYTADDAKKVCDAWNYGIGTHNAYYSYNKSQYKAPTKWDKKWIAVFYQYGPQEWGRFGYGYNFELHDGLRAYYENWENQYRTVAASTKGKYDFDSNPTTAQSSAQFSAFSCSDSGKYISTSGRCV